MLDLQALEELGDRCGLVRLAMAARKHLLSLRGARLEMRRGDGDQRTALQGLELSLRAGDRDAIDSRYGDDTLLFALGLCIGFAAAAVGLGLLVRAARTTHMAVFERKSTSARAGGRFEPADGLGNVVAQHTEHLGRKGDLDRALGDRLRAQAGAGHWLAVNDLGGRASGVGRRKPEREIGAERDAGFFGALDAADEAREEGGSLARALQSEPTERLRLELAGGLVSYRRQDCTARKQRELLDELRIQLRH